MIDLGSNTFRLVVFRYAPGGPFQLIDEVRESVRLPAGSRGGRLAPEALARTRSMPEERQNSAYRRETWRARAVATSAVRDARNARQTLAAVSADGALPVEVLDSEGEARLAWLGAANSTTLTDGLLLDIGGGSLQLGRITGRRLRRVAGEPLGAVRMTEAFLSGTRPAPRAIRALREHTRERLDRHRWLRGRRGRRMVGVGGSIRTLAVMAQKASGYPLDEVHGYVLSREALGGLIEAMAALPPQARTGLAGLKPDRADIMLAGAVAVDEAMARVGVDRLEISSQGLRWGLFYEEFLDGDDPPLLADVRRAHVQNVAAVYGYDRPHAERVAGLALQVYDGLADLRLHRADPLEREWLWAAGILHDIGVVVDYNDHHKHSHYLVLSSGLPGFDHRELAMVALLVRSHRKQMRGPEALAPLLRPGDQARLMRLAACLRLAEQLERGRAQVVRGLRFAGDPDHVRIQALADADATVPVHSARSEAPVFERAFGRRLEVVGPGVDSGDQPSPLSGTAAAPTPPRA